MYCTVDEVLKYIKDDMQDSLISGDEFPEELTKEEQEEVKQEWLNKLCEEAIEDASAEIDGYLAKRYPLELLKSSAVINKFAKDISVYNLVSRQGIEEDTREKTILNRYNQAVKFLLAVAEGKIDIGTESGVSGSQVAASTGFQMHSSPRLFSRETLKGW